jgi:RNA polymerase sigma-70 factor, ECF subfamily
MGHSGPAQGVFSGIYELEFDHVCRSLERLGVQRRDLEDLAQEVFLTAYRCLDQFDAGRPLRPWLFGIAMRVAANHRRLAKHGREVAGVHAESADERPSPEGHAVEREARERVYRALGELSDERRAVFAMHDLNGYSMGEISRALDVPLNTAYSRLRLARADFTSAIRRAAGSGAAP